ncbi:MAG: membrane protein insertion efficiency factor YidD [Candidatus Aureabacteria bacterium]|nr:membrane protein insertion efficiency factor YidD [Candidatus Auribacterota bacterium]MCK5162025.1 membrane protein insertion efficiency factor YidD [Candidatus Auribacterota bacterium]MCK5654747.1 membrane protein insertion efficiency factor YidD [Candidatus Auribacterota bacterium]
MKVIVRTFKFTCLFGRQVGSIPGFCLISLIRLYQKIFFFLPRRCRFYPSCSEYMIEAVQKKGVIKGFLLGCWRILRCNPFCSGGYDPVK